MSSDQYHQGAALHRSLKWEERRARDLRWYLGLPRPIVRMKMTKIVRSHYFDSTPYRSDALPFTLFPKSPVVVPEPEAQTPTPAAIPARVSDDPTYVRADVPKSGSVWVPSPLIDEYLVGWKSLPGTVRPGPARIENVSPAALERNDEREAIPLSHWIVQNAHRFVSRHGWHGRIRPSVSRYEDFAMPTEANPQKRQIPGERLPGLRGEAQRPGSLCGDLLARLADLLLVPDDRSIPHRVMLACKRRVGGNPEGHEKRGQE